MKGCVQWVGWGLGFLLLLLFVGLVVSTVKGPDEGPAAVVTVAPKVDLLAGGKQAERLDWRPGSDLVKNRAGAVVEPGGADPVQSDVEIIDGLLAQFTRLTLRLVGALFVASVGVMVVVIPLRLAFAGDVAGDVARVLAGVKGRWEADPVGAAPPPGQDDSGDLARLAELQELTHFCRVALGVQSFAFGQMSGAGLGMGGERWRQTIERLAHDGFAFRVRGGGGKWRWVPKKGKASFLDALAHYSDLAKRVT